MMDERRYEAKDVHANYMARKASEIDDLGRDGRAFVCN